MEKMRNAYKILVGKSKAKRPLGRGRWDIILTWTLQIDYQLLKEDCTPWSWHFYLVKRKVVQITGKMVGPTVWQHVIQVTAIRVQ
jgi:hypothetical protein